LGVLGSAAAVLVVSGLAYELLQWKRPRRFWWRLAGALLGVLSGIPVGASVPVLVAWAWAFIGWFPPLAALLPGN
jgi:hypothetical protein